MADPSFQPPASEESTKDACPHIYVQDTDAQFPATHTTGFGM